ncbi:MAG: multiheme c-type cytochrome, partial [Sedimenticola sp.]
MKRLALLAVAALVGWGGFISSASAAGKACLACHEGIERFSDGVMQEDIEKMGAELGDPAGCVVCHGGNPAEEKDKAKAHMGSPKMLAKKGGPKNFLPDPGAMPVNDQACGQCHSGYFDRLNKSLMNTEAGKLQGNMWSWGVQKDMKVVWGNYDVIDEDGPVPLVGTKAYKKYMKDFVKKHPDQMPKRLKQLPQVNLDTLTDNPNHAGYTYSRHDCQRCHVGVNGRDKRGDYRGAGCSACHVPYSNDGFYEGGDPTIKKDEAGHVLTHRMQGTRKTKVKVGEVEYSGIPVETCVSCHNRGKRVGVSYQGIMEAPYGSPFDAKGNKQPKMHTKRYLFIKEDLHHEMNSIAGNPKGGMLCQDCHTTIDLHGDGNIPGTTLAQVEVECEDCHGTFDKLPWDMPLGRGEEFGEMKNGQPAGPARGLGKKWPEFMKDATQYEPQDGYLLTARGNP